MKNAESAMAYNYVPSNLKVNMCSIPEHCRKHFRKYEHCHKHKFKY